VNFLTWMFVATGILFVVAGIPMAQRRVPPNPWYGFRVTKTLTPGNERVWYDANAYCGNLMIVVGLVHTASAVLLRYVPGLNNNKDSYSWAVLAVLMPAMLWMVVMSLRYLKTL
jgi:hypothetical protein